MEPITRRSFLVTGSAGAAGAAAVGLFGGAAITDRTDAAGELQSQELEELEALSRPVLLQVRNAAAGEVELLVEDREVVFTDRALVARVLRAAR